MKYIYTNKRSYASTNESEALRAHEPSLIIQNLYQSVTNDICHFMDETSFAIKRRKRIRMNDNGCLPSNMLRFVVTTARSPICTDNYDESLLLCYSLLT
jgi:hypothetical protein